MQFVIIFNGNILSWRHFYRIHFISETLYSPRYYNGTQVFLSARKTHVHMSAAADRGGRRLGIVTWTLRLGIVPLTQKRWLELFRSVIGSVATFPFRRPSRTESAGRSLLNRTHVQFAHMVTCRASVYPACDWSDAIRSSRDIRWAVLGLVFRTDSDDAPEIWKPVKNEL